MTENAVTRMDCKPILRARPQHRNTDWASASRNTRLWFVPAGEDHLGCAYVGFDDGWAQGGVNSAGLAFDWVAGFEEPYEPDPKLVPVRGNPAERMLESCRTVEEAVAFFRAHLEPDFRRSRILVADASGASAAIGAMKGKLHVAQRNVSRGFGWGRAALEAELAKQPAPTVENGAAILRACLQPGDGGTKYSTIYDLKQGTLVLFPSPLERSGERITLDLAGELAKGGHYYDIPRIRAQLDGAPQPLLPSMRRFYLDEFQALEEQDPVIIARIEAIIRAAAAGQMLQADYAPELWEQLAGIRDDIRNDMQRLGRLRSLVLVEQQEEPEQRSYRCIADFAHARVLGYYAFNEHSQVTGIRSEFAEMKRRSAESSEK